MLTHKIFVGRHVYNCHLAIFWKFNSVPDVSNLLKLPTPILLEVSLSTMGTVFVRFHFRLRQHIVYFHWSSPFQTYLSISPFTIVFYFLLFLNFRIPITRNLIILFFLPLLSSTLPKSELRAAITTISTYDHSKVSPSKNEEKSPTAALSVTYTFLFHVRVYIRSNFHRQPPKGLFGMYGSEVWWAEYFRRSQCRVDDPALADLFIAPSFFKCVEQLNYVSFSFWLDWEGGDTAN